LPLIKREFFIPCKGDECFKLAELINEKIPQVELIDIDISDHGLRIKMYGYKSDVRRAWNTIKQLVRIYRTPYIMEHGRLRRMPIQYIVERIKRTFPPSLLVYILKKKGYRAALSEDGEEIVSDAEPDYIVEIASRIADLTQRIKDFTRGTSTKYFIIAASILLDKDPEYIVEKAFAMGLLEKINDRFIIKKEWRQALEEVIKDEKHSIES
jgi:hypothetical protein